MRPFIVPGVVVCVLLIVPKVGAADEPTPRSELRKNQGVWKIEKAVYEGRERGDVEDKMTITIDFDSAKWIAEYNRANATEEKIVFDPSKDPKAIDIGLGRGQRLGIYRYTSDGGLEICLNQAGKPRPTAFTTEKGTEGRGSVYYLLKKKEK
jgi:uncharacterized protein (TIGR03067 family)